MTVREVHYLDAIIIQYLGFEAKDRVREYSFTAREAPAERRAYTVTIANEAFESHRASYQEGPGICLLRLRTELTAGTPHAETTSFHVTDIELAAYHDKHKPKVARSFTPRKTE